MGFQPTRVWRSLLGEYGVVEYGKFIWVFPNIGVPQNGCFIRENPIKIYDLVVPLFLETFIWGLQTQCDILFSDYKPSYMYIHLPNVSYLFASYTHTHSLYIQSLKIHIKHKFSIIENDPSCRYNLEI